VPEKEYQNIRVEVEDDLGLVYLNRPNALNALSSGLMRELLESLRAFDSEEKIRCIVITGSDKVFSAGADIKEMAGWSSVQALKEGNLERFDSIRKISKPIIAAISGYALGGGLELAMACDIIVAAEGTKLGQPEINIGVFPGAGGTQRLTRTIGKYRAMDLILTGNMISATEAQGMGLVSRVVANDLYFTEAKKLGHEIALKAPLAVKMAKMAILKAFDTSLAEGLEFEHKNFYTILSSEDKEEGMKAFLEKRKPTYKGR
jgi:enoyl-CoA hydratase